jgi:hypothetical protein
MDTQELVDYLDELLYDSTGKHIDSLQVAILKGVLNGAKYKDIADDYKCSASHAKDEAYKLWRSLSDTLNEDINKSNFKATIDRIINKNTNNNRGVIVNSNQIDRVNICPNSHSKIEENEDIIGISNNFRFKIIRQALFFCGEFSDYNLLNKVLKSTLEYRGLPA